MSLTRLHFALIVLASVAIEISAAEEITPLPPVAANNGVQLTHHEDAASSIGPIQYSQGGLPSSVDVALMSTPSQQPAHGLTEADVERIVAEYLAMRSKETVVSSSDAEAPLPLPADKLPLIEENWYHVGSDKKFTAQWNNGLEFQSANKDFKTHVGGRIQFDTSFFNNDDYLEQPVSLGGIGSLQDSMQFRRARFRIDGTMYEQIEYAFEFEFLNDNSVDFAQTPPVANTVPSATDLWINFTQLPILGNVKVGNQKNPIGFEHMESSRYLDFIERSFNQDLFYSPFNNGFSPGVTASNTAFNKRASWAVGVFAANMNANTNIFAYGLGSDYAYTLRGTMLPYWDQDGRYMVHVGASYEYRDADDGRVRVRSRGNIRNGPPGPFNAVYADTTNLVADEQDLINLEAVCQWGSLLVQGEYCFSNIYDATQVVGVAAPTGRGNLWLNGGYIEMLYFLTGEHRVYSYERAAFDRVVPHQNAFRVRGRNNCVCQGLGAWQVGIRFDHADLNDNGLNGGLLNGLTLGVNWFLNPNMKLQYNWDWTHRGRVSRFNPAAGAMNDVEPGDAFGFATRLAIDF